MKKIFIRFLIFTFSFFFFFFFISAEAAETYTLDPAHSYVMWHINHFGFSNPSGKWMAKGTLFLDEEKPQNSKVNAMIQVGQVITGIPKLDEHLISKDFFNAALFPTATFVSNQIEMINKERAYVHGILTLHGISKPVILDVKLNKIGVNPINSKKTIGFSATTELKRSDFGISADLPGLSDKVELNIEVEANA